MAAGVTFEGVFPVLPTPLRSDQSPDLDALAVLAVHYLSRGIHGLVCLGSGGESPYFSFEEKREIIRCVASAVRGHLPVIVGTGCLSTKETISLSEYAAGWGVDGLLLALPTYYPVGAGAAYAHIKAVSDACRRPILYYHFPEATRLRLSPADVARICEIDMVVGIKETTLNLRQVSAHLSLVKKTPFSVLAGTSFLLRDVLSRGGSGVICPLPLLIPEAVAGLYECVRRGDRAGADIHEGTIFRALPLVTGRRMSPRVGRIAFKILARLGGPARTASPALPAVFKEALRQLGLPLSPIVRSPLMQIDEYRARLVESVLKDLPVRPPFPQTA